MAACGYWDAGAVCGSTDDVHRYIVGDRCRKHTPAALAGRPEPRADPTLTLEALQARGGLKSAYSSPPAARPTGPPPKPGRGRRTHLAAAARESARIAAEQARRKRKDAPG